MNSCVYSGWVVKDPALQEIKGTDKKLCRFTLAVRKDYLSKEQKEKMEKEGKKTVDYFDIEANEFFYNALRKGSHILVQGRTKNYNSKNEKDGIVYMNYKNIVVASKIEFLDSASKDKSATATDDTPYSNDEDYGDEDDDDEVPF